jgi:ABC-type lipoprotein release transport system permease subunit
MKTTGYSGTQLAKKLGIKQGFKIKLYNEPDYYYDLFSDLPTDIKELKDKKSKKDFIHYFAKNTAQLNKDIKQLRQEIEENGMIWISWYKKSAKIETDLNENIIRDIALNNGLVDVKVCAIDEIWSGLKLVIRLNDRTK